MKKVLNKIIFLLFLIMLNIPNVLAEEANNENYLFISEFCLECREINDEVFDWCEEKSITVINIDENIEFYQKMIDEKGIPSKVPCLIYNGQFYKTSNEIDSLVDSKNVFLLPFLGFFDGFNPCAISILMIFISLLFSLDRNVIKIGLSFILGEVSCNFLIGLGILKIKEYLTQYNIFINYIYVLSLIMCLYVIILNSIDIYNGLTKKEKINNQLSSKTKFKIASLINKNIGSKYILFIAFFLGSIIAVLEFGCTGQIYLPSIMYMENNILYLLIYNLFFSLPLIIFLFIGYILNKPEKIKTFIMKKSYILKIIFNIILIILSLDILKRLLK